MSSAIQLPLSRQQVMSHITTPITGGTQDSAVIQAFDANGIKVVFNVTRQMVGSQRTTTIWKQLWKSGAQLPFFSQHTTLTTVVSPVDGNGNTPVSVTISDSIAGNLGPLQMWVKPGTENPFSGLTADGDFLNAAFYQKGLLN